METTLTLTIHGLTLAGIVTILGFLLKQHGVFVRAKDRLNSLWREYCDAHGTPYEPLENGRR